jgi:DNA polymerase-3 subunit gamma/tau
MARKERAATDVSTAAGIHYKVLARRWRPQQFTDLVGQEAIAQALTGAITAERVAHAYLFTGARGVGKTTTARILAKALNCKTGPTTTPCDKCDSCESIASGDDIDVIEIDGASNRGIDEVRELRQNANLRPTRGRYKIYIIDEVHMLTREAFNALLKTLEEPPEHVKFIFATTDPQKIPVTILSRCQRFDFGTISSERIQKRLQEIVRAEAIAVDDDVLELVTRRAAGSMRDSLSLLDQLLAFGGERVTADQVHRLLGTAREDRLMELVASLIDRQPGRAIEIVDEAESQGVQLGELIDQVIEYFRDLMVVKSAGSNARLVSVSSRQRARITEQALGLSLDFIFAAADILSEAKGRLRGSSYGRVLVDIALARIASLEELGSIAELADRLEGLESRLGASAATPAARAHSTAAAPAREPATADSKKKAIVADRPAAPAAPAPAAAIAETPPVPPQVAAAPVPPHVSTPPPGVVEPATAIPRPLTDETAGELLRALAAAFAPVLRESISRARISVRAADSVVVYLDPMYNKSDRAKEIETSLQAQLGPGLKIRVELDQPGKSAREPHAKRSSYSERLSEANRDPLVREAIDVLGARVIRVDET